MLRLFWPRGTKISTGEMPGIRASLTRTRRTEGLGECMLIQGAAMEPSHVVRQNDRSFSYRRGSPGFIDPKFIRLGLQARLPSEAIPLSSLLLSIHSFTTAGGIATTRWA